MATKKKTAKTSTTKASPKPAMKAKKPSASKATDGDALAWAAAPVAGTLADYQRFAPVAEKIEARDVAVMRADPNLAYHNVEAGVALLAPLEAQVKSDLPKEKFAELVETKSIALGLAYIANAADVAPDGSTGEIGKLLAEASALRAILMPAAESAAASGLVDAREVKNIRAGRGKLDLAKDNVALAALFRTSAAALRGKTSVTPQQVARAEEVGTALVALIRPKGTVKRTKKGAKADLADARNRMWTLLLNRYERVERVIAYLLGPRFPCPRLLSRVSTPSKKPKKGETPKPA
jgi:hypothetical protein